MLNDKPNAKARLNKGLPLDDAWVAKQAFLHAALGITIGLAATPMLVAIIGWLSWNNSQSLWRAIPDSYAAFLSTGLKPALALGLGVPIAFAFEFRRIRKLRNELLKEEHRCTVCSYALPDADTATCPECGHINRKGTLRSPPPDESQPT